MAREREREIRRRRQRRHKVAKLKARLAATKDSLERQQIIEKIKKINPLFEIEK